MASAVSIGRAFPATQIPSQMSAGGRQEGAANFPEFVANKVATVARLLSSLAPHGFCQRVAALMGWKRTERRSREVSGVERLSLDTVLAELHVHAEEGRQEAVDQLVAALLDALRTASLPVRPDSTVQMYDRNGQRFLRFER